MPPVLLKKHMRQGTDGTGADEPFLCGNPDDGVMSYPNCDDTGVCW